MSLPSSSSQFVQTSHRPSASGEVHCFHTRLKSQPPWIIFFLSKKPRNFVGCRSLQSKVLKKKILDANKKKGGPGSKFGGHHFWYSFLFMFRAIQPNQLLGINHLLSSKKISHKAPPKYVNFTLLLGVFPPGVIILPTQTIYHFSWKSFKLTHTFALFHPPPQKKVADIPICWCRWTVTPLKSIHPPSPCRCPGASQCTEMMSAPALAKSSTRCSGSTIIKWQSSTASGWAFLRNSRYAAGREAISARFKRFSSHKLTRQTWNMKFHPDWWKWRYPEISLLIV